jgi:hypothetical protein
MILIFTEVRASDLKEREGEENCSSNNNGSTGPTNGTKT